MGVEFGMFDYQQITSTRVSEAIAFDFIGWWKLRQRYVSVMATNIYLPDWFEADVCCIRDSGLIDEFEIKISRGDFFADAKKRGFDQRLKYDRLRTGQSEHNLATFTYITPRGLIQTSELPDFAGLIEVDLPAPAKRKPIRNGVDSSVASFQITVHAPKLRKHVDQSVLAAVAALHKTMAHRYFDCYRQGVTLKKGRPRYPE